MVGLQKRNSSLLGRQEEKNKSETERGRTGKKKEGKRGNGKKRTKKNWGGIPRAGPLTEVSWEKNLRTSRERKGVGSVAETESDQGQGGRHTRDGAEEKSWVRDGGENAESDTGNLQADEQKHGDLPACCTTSLPRGHVRGLCGGLDTSGMEKDSRHGIFLQERAILSWWYKKRPGGKIPLGRACFAR